jgi:hypothetical protein
MLVLLQETDKHNVGMTSSGMTFIPNFLEICQFVQFVGETVI